MTHWANSVGQFKSSALADATGALVSDTEEKINLLRTVLLPAGREELGIGPPDLPPIDGESDWPVLTRHEVEQALCKSRNTTPGLDEVVPAAIKKAWPYIGGTVYSLYALYLQEG